MVRFEELRVRLGSLNPQGSPYPNTPGEPYYNVYHFKLDGDRVCGNVRIDFGDGSNPVQSSGYDFSNPTQFDHYYGLGWGGKKTVKAVGLQNCVGTAQMIIEITPSVYKLAYAQPRPSACDFVPNKPALRPNTKVHITTNPDPSIKINFGCLFNNCVFDADGINSMATSGYPFPGLRPLSLVLRVGTEVFQGGTDRMFTTHQTGRLEVCVNDDNLSDNTGAWGLFIEVDESGAP